MTTHISGTYVAGGGVSRLYFLEAGGTAQQAATATFNFWDAMKTVFHVSQLMAVSPIVDTVDTINGKLTGQTAVTAATSSATASEEPLPAQCQGLIRLLTGVFSDGSQIRGRIYLPSLTEADWTNGGWTSGRLTTIQNAANGLIADPNSQLLVWRRQRVFDPPKQELPNRDGEHAVVTTANVWDRLAVLRSRRD